jgi:hypothetical protein
MAQTNRTEWIRFWRASSKVSPASEGRR